MGKRSTVKTLTIDDVQVGAHEDETILDVARENGLFIPTLCEIDGLSIVGSCRLCLVQVEGWNKLVPACATTVEEGMVVHTSTPEIDEYRRIILELLFAEGNHVCSVCVANGHCDLQFLAGKLGMTHVRFPYLSERTGVDMSHAYFGLDHNRCILCTRCVRVCDEIEGAHNWDLLGRGIAAHVISDFSTPWGDSQTCTSCGKCVNVCPTGALFEKGRAVGEMTKRREFLEYLTRMRQNGSE